MGSETTGRRTVRVRITGEVQGVGFRMWAERNARALDLNGWVRNRRDGAVEALFSGASGAVRNMLERCSQGPIGASVDEVVILEEGGTAPLGFSFLPTA